ncbi:beta strand repeat-containing protein, partial [Planctomycetota bacterium]
MMTCRWTWEQLAYSSSQNKHFALIPRFGSWFKTKSSAPKAASVFFVFLSFLLTSANLFAADILWQGDVDNKWSTNGNWSGGSKPDGGDRAIIDDGAVGPNFNPTCDSVETVNELRIENGRALIIAAGAVLTVTADLDVFTGGLLNMDSGTLSVRDLDIRAGGFADIDGGTLSATDDIRLQDGFPVGARLDIDNATVSCVDDFLLDGNGTVGRGGYLQMNSGTLNAGSAASASFEVGDGTTDNATVLINGGTVNVAGDVLIRSGSSITMNNAGSLLTVKDDWTRQGTFTANNGTVRFVTGTSNSTINQATTFYNLECAKGGRQVDISAGIVVTNGFTFTSGTFDLNALTADINGSVTVSGASSLIASTVAGLFRVAGDWTNNAAFNHTTNGTVRFDGGVAQALDGTTQPTFLNLDINNTSAVTLGVNIAASNDLSITDGSLDTSGTDYSLDIGHDFILSAAGTLTANDSSIMLDEDWTNNGGTFNRGNSSVTFDNDAANSIIGGSATTTFYNITVNDSGNSVTLGIATNIANDLTVTNGTFTTSGTDYALDIDGNVLVNGGILTLNGSPVSVGNNWTFTSGTINSNTSTVTLDGGDQSINGSTTFNNLTKNVAATTTLTFQNGTTQIIAGTMDFQGTAKDKRLLLRSDSDGDQWNINPQGGRTVAFLDVKDSININAAAISARSTGSKDSGNNVNWDIVGITVNPTVGLTTTEAGGQAQFTVVLDSEPADSVTIGISSSDVSEGTVSTGLLTFTTGDWDSAQTVTITGQDDLIDDQNVAYTIITAAATSTDGLYDGINASDVSVTNTDNDDVTISINDITLAEGNAGPTAFGFTVSLSIISVQ